MPSFFCFSSVAQCSPRTQRPPPAPPWTQPARPRLLCLKTSPLRQRTAAMTVARDLCFSRSRTWARRSARRWAWVLGRRRTPRRPPSWLASRPWSPTPPPTALTTARTWLPRMSCALTWRRTGARSRWPVSRRGPRASSSGARCNRSCALAGRRSSTTVLPTRAHLGARCLTNGRKWCCPVWKTT